ncbi:hypothetical protein EW145_g1418 [Phellinidium pouzarii]|uniref:HTH APSES-type domain-containing protein n=1 Tax=Phellinidium pouzarii TaxID=167371 RepID=A0A4S4LEJ4_9AGAM|nr:hypothetical protein EW145_g1418 [Phellinidium pouzarii]
MPDTPPPYSDEDARQLLRALAAQVRPIMKSHGFAVNSFEEYEYNQVFAGRNWNNGETVELVLRRADGTFTSIPWLLSTLCHEASKLAHIKHMNHGRDFQKLWTQLRMEVRALQEKGYYGDGYWSSGTRITDSARVGGNGIEEYDLPDYVCGGAQTRSRPKAYGRRRRAQRRVAGPSKYTGAQTEKRRKPGTRVRAKGTFKGDGRALNADVSDEDEKARGTGFRKQAGSKRAREERAMAAERRFKALQGTPGKSELQEAPSDGDFGTESESEDHSGDPAENDERRRKIMRDSMKDNEINSSQQFMNDFLNESSRVKEELEAVKFSNVFDAIELSDDDDAYNIPSTSDPVISQPPKTLNEDDRRPAKRSRKLSPTLATRTSQSIQRPGKSIGLGRLAQEEMSVRRRESLGMDGSGRKLGYGSTSAYMLPSRSAITEASADTTAVDRSDKESWACLLVQLVAPLEETLPGTDNMSNAYITQASVCRPIPHFACAFHGACFSMSNLSPNVVPKTNTPRPQLPFAHANPFLAMSAYIDTLHADVTFTMPFSSRIADNTKLPNVKYQVITREGQEIVVGRVKIQTPGGGHAFVLRRFDTGAVSLTTMFRAAFPSAPDEAEKTESSWVKANFDSYGANGGVGKDILRLAGTWVRPDVAATIAPLYSLDYVISPLVNAAPDPRQEYRRSTKPTSPNGNSSPLKATNPRIEVDSPPSPSPAAGPAPTKRRKESSPVITSPTKASAETLPVPRRSGRTASPAPISTTSQTTATVSSTTRTSRVKTSKTRAFVKPPSTGKPSNRLTPVESDHAHNDDDGSDDVAEVPGPNMHEDIAEQKELIAKLKAERAERQERAAEAAANAANISAVPLQQSDSQSSKRSREEEDQPLKFKFRKPDAQNPVVNRQIKSNKRLSLDLEPQQKSAAWGALWFAAGLAAAATIPSFFM